MHRFTSDPPLITKTTASTAADQEEFISQNIDALSCFAYARYREVGRGLIALFPEQFFEASGQVSKGDLFYIKRSQLLPLVERWEGENSARNEFLQELWHTVDAYDPALCVVIAFLKLQNSNKGINTYLVDCLTPPPFAYAAYTN